jgi:release factor glutamine methyltransferase
MRGGSQAQVNALVQLAVERLIDAGVENPRLDAELLMASAAGITRERLFADSTVASDATRERYAVLVGLRAARLPLAYITSRREFYSLELEVSREVLIPRPETETLVSAALDYLGSCCASRIIDLGTGSGAIALAIAAHAPLVKIVATDVSGDALAVAARNAARLGLSERVELRRADCWMTTDGGDSLDRFDLIVANPPYVPDAEIASLAPEIRQFEPRVALAGGADGLVLYRRIADQARNHLMDEGILMVEVGHDQAGDVAKIFRDSGLGGTTVVNDLAGIPRVVQARSL